MLSALNFWNNTRTSEAHIGVGSSLFIGLRKLLSTLFVVFFLVMLVSSCSKLSGSSGFDKEGYKFPGIGSVRANGDGAFVLSWEAAPARTPMYAIFIKQGTDADPSANGQEFDFSRPWRRVADNSVLTDNLILAHNTCFVVRLELSGYQDVNTAEQCTNHERYVFPGIASLDYGGDGSYVLSWDSVPADGVIYNIYERLTSGSYDFARPLVSDVKLLTHATGNLFGMETRCYVVRSVIYDSNYRDLNTAELCTETVVLAGFENYRGCLSVVTEGLRTAVIDFEFPASASKINLYRDRSLIFTGDSPSVSVFRDTSLEMGKEYRYSCEAIVNGLPVTGSQSLTARTTGVPAFEGCVSGQALSSSEIRIDYAVPTSISSFQILRNGVAAFTASATSAGGVGYTEITGLQEGYTYSFRCVATFEGVSIDGTRELTITTLSFNPPLFLGAKTATETIPSAPGTVLLTWEAATGPKAGLYKIYANLGNSVDWTTPTKQVNNLTFSTTVSGLGALLPYSFGVRACSTNDMCDINVVTKTVQTASRNAAPATVGITAAAATNGEIRLTAPWRASDGGLAKRVVYTRVLPVDSSANTAKSTDIADYVLAKEEVVDSNQITDPTTLITVSPIQENTHYHFLLIDQSPASGGQAGVETPITTSRIFYYKTGKLSPPTFGGISQVLSGSPADTSIQVQFAAIAREGTTDIGASSGTSFYDLYLTSAPFVTSTPSVANACSATTAYASYAADDSLPPGQQTLVINGLTPRTTYSVCLKARDSAGNSSTSTNSILVTTRDLTPPVFSGVQGFARNVTDGSLSLSWNGATAADLASYRIDLWKCTNAQFSSNDPACRPLADGGSASVVSRSRVATAAANITSTAISNQEFALGNYQTIFVLVSACDNADLITGGSSNCSAHSVTTAKVISLAEVAPPADFPGIASEQLFVSDVEGEVLVKWLAPDGGFTADYAGFRIYSTDIDGSNMVLRNTVWCSLPGTGCPTEGRVSGLNAFRTYGFYVAAVSPADNSTLSYLLPTTNYTKYKRTKDGTPPTFLSGLQVTGTASPTLSWQAATDNQYAAEAGAILRYKVYKKAGSNFAIPTIPSGDGTLLNVAGSGYTVSSNDSTLSYTDATVTEGTWFFTVCALDASGNQTCDGTVRTIYLNDSTPPILNSLSLTRAGSAKTWSLGWQMKDNISVTRVRIYQKLSTVTPSAATTCTDILNPDAPEDYDSATELGMRVVRDDGTATPADTFLTGSWANLHGPQNVDRCVTYLVRISDSAGNEATASVSTYSQNLITVSDISRGEGNSVGGKTVVITGTGFSLPTVTIGGNPCTSLRVVAATVKLTCITPAGSLGAQDVVLTNEDGSEATLDSGYTYKNTSTAASADICNLNNWGENDFASGDGSAGSPFTICNPNHFDKLRQTTPVNYLNHATLRYYQLGDNLDFSAYNTIADTPDFYPIGCTVAGCGTNANFAALSLDGNNYTIANFTFLNSAFSNVGLFAGFQRGTVKRVNLLNFNIQASSVAGMLFGGFHPLEADTLLLVEDVSANGTVTAGSSSGGIGGGALENGQSIATFNRVNTSVTVKGNYAGGVYGVARYATCSYCSTKVVLLDANYSGGVFGAIAPVNGGSFGPTLILNSNASVTLSASTATPTVSYVGGLIGYTATGFTPSLTIDKSSAKLSTLNLATVTFSRVGGLVGGINYSAVPMSITKSYATGRIDAVVNISSPGLSGLIGGFDANNCKPLLIQDSYSDLAVNNNATAGIFYSYIGPGCSNNVNIIRTYTTQNATYGLFSLPANGQHGISLTSTFWLYDPASPAIERGVLSGWRDTVTPAVVFDSATRALTHAEMGTKSAFSSQGWDFDSASPVWMMPAGGGPPQLIGVPAPP